MGGTEKQALARALEHRVALITGGSRGIGFAAASAFAEAGARVAIAARTASEVQAAAQALEGRHRTKVLGAAGDVADRTFCAGLVRQVGDALGPVDILVNNAGIQGPLGPIETLPENAWLETFAVNLHAAVRLMQLVIPDMKRRRRGVILNLSGGGATSPRERFAAYAATKTALVRVTEIAALELAPFGVRVNAIAPGMVRTRMTEAVEQAGDAAGPATAAELAKLRESGGTPPELAAELMVFLASDAAAGISGRLLSAVWDDWRGLRDGGWRIQDPDRFTLRRRV